MAFGHSAAAGAGCGRLRRDLTGADPGVRACIQLRSHREAGQKPHTNDSRAALVMANRWKHDDEVMPAE